MSLQVRQRCRVLRNVEYEETKRTTTKVLTIIQKYQEETVIRLKENEERF